MRGSINFRIVYYQLPRNYLISVMAANNYPHVSQGGLWEAYFVQTGHIAIHPAFENPAVIDALEYPESDTDDENEYEYTGDEAGSAGSGSQTDGGSGVDSQSHISCTTQRKPVKEYTAGDVMRRIMEPGGGLTNQVQCEMLSRFCPKATIYKL